MDGYLNTSNEHQTNHKMESASTMGSGHLGREIDLEQLVNALQEYNDELEVNFSNPSMVTLRFEKEGPAITIYRTGGFQIRGTRDIDDLYNSKSDFLNHLTEIGFVRENTEFKHVNTVYLGDLNTELPLEALAIELGLENVEYEPEQFPGIIYRPPTLETVLLIFASGKTIITGTTRQEIAAEALTQLQNTVERYR